MDEALRFCPDRSLLDEVVLPFVVFFDDELVELDFCTISAKTDVKPSVEVFSDSFGVRRTLRRREDLGFEFLRGFFREEEGDLLERFLVPGRVSSSFFFGRLVLLLVDTIFENEFGLRDDLKL